MINAPFLDDYWSKHPCSSEIHDGWLWLVAQLHTDLIKIDPDYRIDQVKEKFGGLRYYVTLSCDKEKSDQCYELISKAEKDSFTICETCGLPGKELDTGWLLTTCERCKKELIDNRNNAVYTENRDKIQAEVKERFLPLFQSLGLTYYNLDDDDEE